MDRRKVVKQIFSVGGIIFFSEVLFGRSRDKDPNSTRPRRTRSPNDEGNENDRHLGPQKHNSRHPLRDEAAPRSDQSSPGQSRFFGKTQQNPDRKDSQDIDTHLGTRKTNK
jgi:hypothetical protein